MSNVVQAINNLDKTINTFKSKVDIKVEQVQSSTNNIQATTDRIYDNINRFKTEMLHGEEKQIAHENILRIDQIIKDQFSIHTTVRRTVIGVVRDFDINLVRNSTIQELSEELWITSSRYWLSYALMAITAWVNNYEQVAHNALAESSRKDPIKTTLFFCLMNLRFNRIDTAKNWFIEYFKTLDPSELQQETAILLQAFLNGVFGKDKGLEHEVIKLIEEWVALINEDEEISRELTAAYSSYIGNLSPNINFQFEAVEKHCSNYRVLEASYKEVSKYDLLLSLVKEYDAEAGLYDDINYKSRVDVILQNLITNYDGEELELKKQQGYYKCILENNGVLEAAEAQYKAMEDLQNNNFNIGKQMLKWALYDESSQTDIQVRKFGFQNTKNWFKNAISTWSSEMNEAFPMIYSLNIDSWQGNTTSQDYAEQAESMRNHFNNNKFTNMYINNINIAATIVVIASIALAFYMVYSLIAAVAGIGFLAFRVIKAQKEYPNRIKKALEALDQCMDELGEIRRYFEENRGKQDVLFSSVEFL